MSRTTYSRRALTSVIFVTLAIGLSIGLYLLGQRYYVGSTEDTVGLQLHPALRKPPAPDESDRLFTRNDVLPLVLELDAENAQKLREDPRAYVKCRVREGDSEPMLVGLKLKGAAGSFRELDDRPAFTVNVNKYRKQQRFYLLEKLYLNNSVQDDSYYSEWLCAEICQQLRLPAPRIGFARVWLNDRDLGLYVLKEGFDQSFLRRHFKDASGSLYDGGFLQDIDIDLEKDLGEPVDDRGDLEQLRAACEEQDPQRQRSALEQTLDVQAFLTFMAFEMLACHWDGYVANQNNYRLYFPPKRGAWFLPHGMDQMFQDPGFSVFVPRTTWVTRAVRNQPDWNEAYRQRVQQLLPLFEPARLIPLLEQLEQRLRPELIKLDPECGPVRDEILQQWRERLTQRYTNIIEQLNQPDPLPPVEELADQEPLRLEPGETVPLEELYPRQETSASNLSTSEEETVVYRIEAGDADDCIASWRCGVQLPPGTYRFQVEMRGAGIRPRGSNQVAGDENGEQQNSTIPNVTDEKGTGAGVRISGSNRTDGLMDTFDWQPTAYEFDVVAEQTSADRENQDAAAEEEAGEHGDESVHAYPIELVAELRASAGWCEIRLPTITRLK